MEYNHILVRFGELSTKGKNKKDFIVRLRNNAKNALNDFPNLKFETMHDRMFVILHGEDKDAVCERLQHVFGIHSFSPAVKSSKDIEEIACIALEMMQENEGCTFKVDARRSDKSYPMNSDEINRYVATKILKNTTCKVNVRQPDIRLQIEIRPDCAYVLSKVIMGAGGYPVGAGGKALVMLSGGIDSPVASYLTMKRGIEIECIHYASPPYTSDRAKQKVIDLARKLARYQGRVKLHIVPFTDIQLEIYKHASESYPITIMRRMMYRIGQRVAEKNNCKALVNGESVGQVASQTLESMDTINCVVDISVLRPVVTYDKLEIIDVAKKIDTYELSIQPFEDCCTIFTPKNPVTKPTRKRAESFERWDYEKMIEDCVNATETIVIYPQNENEDLF
ncbi:MAG: tRNA 4-thiouridine(8) synthase ThiI [Erysipelotrichales bacterium]|nr:tRNA 4-thiouridine(8) synthase ThiI [Erysipelotrichales bacterium]